MPTYQIMHDGSRRPLRSTGRKVYGKNVSLVSTNYPNGCAYRMPWAVSRDLQGVAITGKELYFRITHVGLKTVAHGGHVQTGFDFEFQTLSGTVLPYVVKSYDGVTGTLFGVLKTDLAGSLLATRGWFYFSNSAWTASREDSTNTFLNATTVLFLPSSTDESSAALNFTGLLPTSDKTLVNPGALCNGNDQISRSLVGDCGSFLLSFLVQSTVADDDNAPMAFGLPTTGATVVFIRHLFGTATGPTGGMTRAWRMGFTTAAGSSYYETANNTAGTGLQHVVMRRVLGSSLEFYINGVLAPWGFKNEPGAVPQTGRINLVGQTYLIGRGAVSASRFWNGYLDCVKFYKDDPKTTTWAAAEYANLLNIDDTVVFGDPEALGGTSLWGEAIELPCNGLASVNFDATRYSSADIGVVSVETASWIDPPGGTLAPLTGNTVQYQNAANVAGLDEGAVRLRNTAGSKVIIPARFIITPSTPPPPPPSGYYKVPNHAGKTKVAVTSRGELITALGTFAPGGGRSSVTHYISIEGPIGGSDGANGSRLNVNVGGTRLHPLVITSPDAGTENWTARANYKVYNTTLTLNQPWTWVYGLWTSFIPTGANTFNTTDGTQNAMDIGADNCFVTACRIRGSKGVWHSGTGTHAAATINFNWFEMVFQSAASVGNGDSCIKSEQGGASGHNWMIARNRTSDAPNAYSITTNPKNARFVYTSPGRTAFLDWSMEYNFMDAGHSHYMEFKTGIKAAKWNHGTGTNNVFGGIYYRGDPPGGGEISYNRLACQETNMNGPNTLFISNWYVNGAGVIGGLFGLTAKSLKQSPTLANDLRGADGTIMVACKANILMPYYFEYTNYHPSSPLGQIAPILFHGHAGGTFQFGSPTSALGGAGTFTFDPSTGHPTNGPVDVFKPGVTKQSGIPSIYTVEVPPILSTTVCGPSANGSTWAG